MEFEKGVIVGQTEDKRVFFVCTATDIVVLYLSRAKNEDNVAVQLGAFIEFIARSAPQREGSSYDCEVVLFRKCNPFCEVVLQKKNSAMIGCKIKRRLPNSSMSNATVAYETDFLKKVEDKNNCLSGDDTGARVVCKRICTYNKETLWLVHEVSYNSDDFEDKRVDDSESTSQQARKNEIGFIFTDGNIDKDLLFIFVPGSNKEYCFPERLRKNSDRRYYIGRWVEFSVRDKGELDERSHVEVIKDVIPTKKIGSRYHIRVKCVWNEEEATEWKYNSPLLWSDLCGYILDNDCFLLKNKVRSPLTADLWIYKCSIEDEIDWALGEDQQEFLSRYNYEPSSGTHPTIPRTTCRQKSLDADISSLMKNRGEKAKYLENWEASAVTLVFPRQTHQQPPIEQNGDYEPNYFRNNRPSSSASFSFYSTENAQHPRATNAAQQENGFDSRRREKAELNDELARLAREAFSHRRLLDALFDVDPELGKSLMSALNRHI